MVSPEAFPGEIRGRADVFLESLVKDFKKPGIVYFIANNEGKGSVVVKISDELTETIKAADIATIGAKVLGGKGAGGRPNFAQGGGPEGEKAEAAEKAMVDYLKGLGLWD